MSTFIREVGIDGVLVQRLVGVADAGEHVCDRIGQHRSSYQLDFVMPGIAPWCASSRRQIRQRPNLLEHGARAAAPVAARVVAHLVLLGRAPA